VKTLFAVFGFLVWLVVASITRGYVLTRLWLWFAVTQFKVAELSVVGAIGLSLIVSLLTYSREDKKGGKQNGEQKAAPERGVVITGVLETLSVSLVFLLMGWIVKQFLVIQ
jgi:hypothetical protein